MTLDRSLCTLATCSVEEYGWYSYIPNMGANIAFLAIFAIFAVVQLYLAIKYRVWGTFAVGLVAGCVAETIGYVGRVLQSYGDGIFKKKSSTKRRPIDNDERSLTSTRRYFVIQLVCLTIAPALISAPVYLSLGRIIKTYGRPFSLLAPRTYAMIFICSDLISLILQAFGGGLAATGKIQHKVDTGVHILVAGLAFQVLSLFVFMALANHLWGRVRKGSYRMNSRFDALREYRAIAVATVTIQIRCIYRVVELAGGFRSEAANDQPAFMVLDGPMIMIAVGALTVCHPGLLFFTEWTRLGVDCGYPDAEHTTLEEKPSSKSVGV
ncbi:hypothetical protein Q7P35_007811 [Cladosporium inversicolor]